MRILIVDDENLARERIRRFLEEEIPGYEVVGEASDGVEALEKIMVLQPDAVILDIRMPGMDGLEVARHLMQLESPPAVIFSTAYDEHAMEAFKVNAIDYLLKPVRCEQLAAALQKANRPNKAQLKALGVSEVGQRIRTHISAASRTGITLIPVEDIYFFRAEHKYVAIRHTKGEVLIEEPLRDIEEEFVERFLRVHRNALVAVSRVTVLEKPVRGHPYVLFEGIPDKLEISRRHFPKLRQLMLAR